MTSEPLVTIVTPSLNQGVFIADAIDSVLAQDYPNVEHLIVEGGSNDETAAVLERYREQVRVIEEQPRRGQAYAVNLGFKAARGEVVGWLNSDDRYCPGAFRAAVRALAQRPGTGIVYSNWDEIDEAGRVIARHRSGPFDLREQLHGIDRVPQPTMFLRRWLLDRAGYLDESLHYVLDYEFLLRASRVTELHWVDETWAQFRIHGDSKTGSQWSAFYSEARGVARAYGGPFFSRSFRDRYLNAAFVKELGGKALRRLGLR
jgi:glycosyltransferase involved in cell wall biosynthesis